MNNSYIGAQVVSFTPSEDGAWARDGACAYAGLAPMFPDPEDHDAEAYAKSLCARCPVVSECLTTALDRNETHGVWGGTTPDERRAMKRAAYNRNARAKSA